jgi:hypothetical protein
MEKTLESRKKATPEVGRRLLKNLTNVSYFVRIVIEKFTAGCSFHEKSWLKNRVNSGKPALHELWRMVILSQALALSREGAETRASARTLRVKPGGEAPDTLSPNHWDG